MNAPVKAGTLVRALDFRDPADVRRFRLAADGRSLRYSVGATRQQVRDAEQAGRPETDRRADDADEHVRNQTHLRIGLHDDARQPAGNATHDQIDEKIHCVASPSMDRTPWRGARFNLRRTA